MIWGLFCREMSILTQIARSSIYPSASGSQFGGAALTQHPCLISYRAYCAPSSVETQVSSPMNRELLAERTRVLDGACQNLKRGCGVESPKISRFTIRTVVFSPHAQPGLANLHELFSPPRQTNPTYPSSSSRHVTSNFRSGREEVGRNDGNCSLLTQMQAQRERRTTKGLAGKRAKWAVAEWVQRNSSLRLRYLSFALALVESNVSPCDPPAQLRTRETKRGCKVTVEELKRKENIIA